MTCIILLATKNGHEFLAQQLDSIKKQSYTNWVIYASDDGSIDNTMNILLRYQKEWGKSKLNIFTGPQLGYAKNFWSLLHRVRRKDCQYIAFCDQDDIWEIDHLKRAIKKIQRTKQPSLFGSRTQYIDKENRLLNFSPLFSREPCFQNALIQNIMGGNTQVFNAALLFKLKKIPLSAPIVSHDWLVYQAVTAVGGKAMYSIHPTVLYRQHPMNIIGRNDRFYDQVRRFVMLLKGQFRQWNNFNLQCLQYLATDMSLFNAEVFRRFVKYRNHNLPLRLLKIHRLYLYRQTLKGQLLLYIGFLLKKI